ncbi:hypothetical protein JIN85_18635 [Luteolibacter pohnpeiensis]|uniref:Uncharacterized protein n=1 Tax=Luteolibacter pohnpeiensis TaxID=454153 RepID=A0A934S7D4_9BACT|nr:hypothetical protein [Luteolibacter pohnpeiensis]MBK1884440.1 hypothetical protein [Luteolibacter pohnpeiensis]
MNTPQPYSPRFAWHSGLLIVTTIVGWWFAGFAPKPDGGRDQPVLQATRTSNRSARPRLESGTPAEVRQKVKTVMAAGSQRDRMLAVMGLVESMDVEELAQWIKAGWFETAAGPEAVLFNKLAALKWARADPEGQLEWSLSNNIVPTGAVRLWATRDPESLVEFLDKHPTNQENAILTILAESDPELVLNRLIEKPSDTSVVSNFFTGSMYQLFANVARLDPELLDEYLNKLPKSNRGIGESISIQTKLNQSFSEEIARLQAQPDGWSRFYDALSTPYLQTDFLREFPSCLTTFSKEWMQKLAAQPSLYIRENNAQQWLEADLESLNFTREQVGDIQKSSLQILASDDPAAAIASLNRLHLSVAERAEMLTELTSYLAKDRNAMTRLKAAIDSPDDLELVNQAIDEKPESWESKSSRWTQQPESWLEAVAENSGSNFSFLLDNLKYWDSTHLAQLSSQFEALPEEEKLKVAEKFSDVWKYGNSDPAFLSTCTAYRLERGQDISPDDPEMQKISSDVSFQVKTWGQVDPIAASRWADDLPECQAKTTARKDLARIWMTYDPDAANQWINSLPSEARAEVRAALAGN